MSGRRFGFSAAFVLGLLLGDEGGASAVKDAQGRLVEGTIAVDREETRWSFTPSAAWRDGAYEISVPGILEDLAGNKVYTPFDVDVTVMPNAPGPSKVYAVPFRVGVAR